MHDSKKNILTKKAWRWVVDLLWIIIIRKIIPNKRTSKMITWSAGNEQIKCQQAKKMVKGRRKKPK